MSQNSADRVFERHVRVPGQRVAGELEHNFPPREEAAAIMGTGWMRVTRRATDSCASKTFRWLPAESAENLHRVFVNGTGHRQAARRALIEAPIVDTIDTLVCSARGLAQSLFGGEY
jgi:hypothetical protein